MLQKHDFGKIKVYLKRFFNELRKFNPRYQLSLDHDYFDVKNNARKYKFKSFGDHGFPAFTFRELKYNEKLLFNINPYDLIKISEKNYSEENLKLLFRVDELLRNNQYKLRNANGTHIFSGEDICNNPLLAEQIEKKALFKIAYNTGFERGRKLAKVIDATLKEHVSTSNVVKLNQVTCE